MTDQQIAKWIDQLQGELDVLKRIASNGSLELSKLGDVSISNPADADIIVYDDQNDKWVNSHLGTFDFISNAYSTINGYVTVVDSAIKTTSLVFIQINRNDDTDGVWSGYSVYPRISTNGEVIIFIRDANGSYPVDGKLISLNVLVYNAGNTTSKKKGGKNNGRH